MDRISYAACKQYIPLPPGDNPIAVNKILLLLLYLSCIVEQKKLYQAI
jgi:hypothetical protein